MTLVVSLQIMLLSLITHTNSKSQKTLHKQNHCQNQKAALNEKPTDSPQWLFIGSSI